METHKTLEVTLEEARKLYKSNKTTLKEMALRCYTKDELDPISFDKIKTFHDAIQALGLDKDQIHQTVRVIEKNSKAAADLLRIFFILKALNKGHKMPLDSDLKKPFPFIVMVDKDTAAHKYYEKCGYTEQIGTVKVNGKYIIVYGGVTATLEDQGCLNYDNETWIDNIRKNSGRHLIKHHGVVYTNYAVPFSVDDKRDESHTEVFWEDIHSEEEMINLIKSDSFLKQQFKM